MAALLNPAGLGRLKPLGSLVTPRGCGVVPRLDDASSVRCKFPCVEERRQHGGHRQGLGKPESRPCIEHTGE